MQSQGAMIPLPDGVDCRNRCQRSRGDLATTNSGFNLLVPVVSSRSLSDRITLSRDLPGFVLCA